MYMMLGLMIGIMYAVNYRHYKIYEIIDEKNGFIDEEYQSLLDIIYPNKDYDQIYNKYSRAITWNNLMILLGIGYTILFSILLFVTNFGEGMNCIFVIQLAFFLIFLVDTFFEISKVKKMVESFEEIQFFLQEQERLKGPRIMYLIIMILIGLLVGFVTDFDLKITTVPDQTSYNQLLANEDISLVGSWKNTFVKQAEIDTNGIFWGVYFIVLGFVGLVVKMTILRLPLNATGKFQFIINLLTILVGFYLLFRLPIYDVMHWPTKVDYSYIDFMNKLKYE